MAEYKTLEKAVYQQVRDSPFTRVQGLPTWLQKQNLVKEMQAAGVGANVSYSWAGDPGLLAEIDGKTKYLADTAELYIKPTKPLQTHASVLVGNSTQTQVRIYTQQSTTCLNTTMQRYWDSEKKSVTTSATHPTKKIGSI